MAEAAHARFNRGVKLYNLGHFEAAIPEFEAAYDLDPAPILIFNIAQSHRQLGNKERAIFFYRRYLEQESNPPNRAEIEQRVKIFSNFTAGLSRELNNEAEAALPYYYQAALADPSMDQLVLAADNALLCAKRDGRNRIVAARPDPPSVTDHSDQPVGD